MLVVFDDQLVRVERLLVHFVVEVGVGEVEADGIGQV